ncbi:MAG TPA: hypothetical protein VF686_00065 [Brevundimonas sp.]
MIGLATLLLALLGPQQQTDTEGRTLIRTYKNPVNGTSRCLRNLPPARRIAVQISCRVNGIGGPTRCTFQPETSPEQRYAAECVARGYRFNWEDGRPATGSTVRFTVHLVTL